jgi:hypothetical protein
MSIVGRDDAKSNTPKKPKLLFPTLGKGVAGNTYVDTINSRITSTSGLDDFEINTVSDLSTDEFISSMSNAQKKTLASLLRKAGFTIRTFDDIDAEIAEFSDLDTASFGKFYKSLASQLIPKEPKTPAADKYAPRIDIYNVPDDELMTDIDEASLSTIGGILSDEEKAKFLPISKALIAKGTRTTYKKSPKGEVITETTPKFTREMGKRAVTEAIEKAPEYKADVDRKQRVDFYSWILEQ